MIDDSPFKFLDAYTAEDRAIFFGRDREIEDLYNLVFKTPLLLVYGLSGTGKTSLIQCGLSSQFDGTDWNPFFVRRGDDINASLAAALQAALPASAPADGTPADRVSTLFRHYLRPVYLIFDQFEELFILGTPAEQAAFAESLAELIAAELPCKIILVMREEFIAQLYTLEKAVPTVYDHRLRVEPMGYPKIREVLAGSFAQFNIGLPHGEAGYEQIYQKVSAGKFGVQLPFLQVYLDMLYREDFARTYPDATQLPDPLPPLEFTEEELDRFGEIEQVLSRFLREQEESIQRRLEADRSEVPDDAVRRLLDGFVTEEGTKRPISFRREGDALLIQGTEAFPGLAPPVIAFIVGELRNARLLRERDGALELAHDSLAALIDQRRTDEQRRRNRLRRLVRSNHELGQPLTAGHLAELGDEVDKLGLEPPLRAFVAESRRQREAEREAELAQERRRRWTAYFIAVVGVLLAAVAGYLGWQADRQSKIVVEERNNVQKALEAAESSEARAEELALAAQDSARVAQQQRQEAIRLTGVAEQESENTRRALADVQRASLRIVNDLLADASADIYHLRHDVALEKLYNAADLDVTVKAAAIADSLLEIAYFLTETRQFERAKDALATITKLRGSSGVGSTFGPDSLKWLRSKLMAVDADRIEFFKRRYYPTMIEVPGGSFCLGALQKAENCTNGVLVRLDPFRMARHETTNWQYHLFAAATNREMQKPSWGWDGDNPVVNTSWFDAIAYANWVSRQRGVDPVYQLPPVPLDPNELDRRVTAWHQIPNWSAAGYRLPTDAEWEYAARSGIRQDTFEYSGSDTLNLVGWNGGNSYQGYGVKRTHSVGKKRLNGLKLYDMSGNVWEWVWDYYNYGREGEAGSNPIGPQNGSTRVSRGGAWDFVDLKSRVTDRFNYDPSYRYDLIGFRLVQG